MDDFTSISVAANGMSERILDHALLSLVEQTEQSVFLHTIFVEDRRHGHGTAALEKLVALADRHGISIRLHAVSILSIGPDTPTLIRWYERFGFTPEPPVPDDWAMLGMPMIRTTRAQPVARNCTLASSPEEL